MIRSKYIPCPSDLPLYSSAGQADLNWTLLTVQGLGPDAAVSQPNAEQLLESISTIHRLNSLGVARVWVVEIPLKQQSWVETRKQ